MSVNIRKIKNDLIKIYPFFGGIIDNTRYFETPNCIVNGRPTAGTDGFTIYYHPDVDKYTEKQQLFLLAHEISHIALKHIERCGNRDKEIWNIAIDAVTNAHLKNDGLELIDGSIDMPWAIDYDAEEVYEIILKEEQEKQQGNKSNESESNSPENKQSGHDDHNLWKDTSRQDKRTIDNKISEKKIFAKDIEENQKEQFLNEIVEILKDKMKGYTEDKIIASSNLSGNGTNSQEFKIKKTNKLYPIINWSLYLKRPIEIVELDWSYQNASIEDGIISATLEESSYLLKYKTEILLDTSGSVEDELLRQFLIECKSILNFSEIKVGCFDTKFYGFKEIRTIQDIDNMTFVGRGGTNFSVAVEAFSNEADNKIIFTDGLANMPNKEMDIIWVIYGGKIIEPKGGKVVYVEEKGLINMSTFDLKLSEKRTQKRLIKIRK